MAGPMAPVIKRGDFRKMANGGRAIIKVRCGRANPTDTVCMYRRAVPNTRVVGKTAKNMDAELIWCPFMSSYLQVVGNTAKSTGVVFKCGINIASLKVARNMRANGRTAKKHGRGVYVLVYSERYDGEFKDGKKHGRGVMMYRNGGSCEGDWRGKRLLGTGTSSYWGQVKVEVKASLVTRDEK